MKVALIPYFSRRFGQCGELPSGAASVTVPGREAGSRGLTAVTAVSTLIFSLSSVPTGGVVGHVGVGSRIGIHDVDAPRKGRCLARVIVDARQTWRPNTTYTVECSSEKHTYFLCGALRYRYTGGVSLNRLHKHFEQPSYFLLDEWESRTSLMIS